MIKKLIFEISKLINCEYELGIWSEINSFMEYYEESISDYALNYLKDEQSFYLDIKMKNFTEDEVNDIFKLLVQYIEYSNATFYVREKNLDTIKYYLLSLIDEEKGVFIQINFS